MARSILPIGIVVILCAGNACVLFEVQEQRLADRIRSRVHVGQSIGDVLVAAEDALVQQGSLMTPAYFFGARCGARVWTLLREPRGNGSVQFRVMSLLPESEEGFVRTSDGSVALNRSETLSFLTVNGRHCTVAVNAGERKLILTLDGDGKVSGID